MSSDFEMLAGEFEREMYETYDQAKRNCDYNAIRFLQMLTEHGGVETAQRLLATGFDAMQSGITELWLCQRLDLSVEAKVLIPKYQPLFSEELRMIARERLVKYEFNVDDWLAGFNKNPPKSYR